MFEIKPVAESSEILGCYGKNTIPLGTVILQEDPISSVFDLSSNMMWDLTKKLLISNQHTKIMSLCSIPVKNATLQKEMAVAFAKENNMLIGNVSKTYHIVCRNAYFISNFITFHRRGLALYDCISKFNHSCNPNCVLVFDNNTGLIVTIRDIEIGEELTVSYYLLASYPIPADERQSLLKKHYDFNCKCQNCKVGVFKEWNDKERDIFRLINETTLGIIFFNVGSKIFNNKKNILDNNPILLIILGVIYIRSFLHEGETEDDAMMASKLAYEGYKVLNEIKDGFFKWYATFIFSIILGHELSENDSKLRRLLLVNDRKDCSVL